MSCELKYRVTSSQCEIVNNNVLSVGNSYGSFDVSITFFFPVTSCGNEQTGSKWHSLINHFPFRLISVLILYKQYTSGYGISCAHFCTVCSDALP